LGTRGFFISFEGIEGSGKSTQVALLHGALEAAGRRVLATREPGGTRLGTALRELLLGGVGLSPAAELLLCVADRAQHVEEVIAPALASGAVILCDRFADSTVAYPGDGRGGDLALSAKLNEVACTDCWPDVTFLLDCPVATGLARAGRRPRSDRFEDEAARFHERVREGYLEIARSAPERVVVLASTRPAEEVHAQVWATALARMAERSPQ
jgi:dTMP kinase